MKPCKFCKGTSIIDDVCNGKHLVFCEDCMASGPHLETQDDARDAWDSLSANSRLDKPAALMALMQYWTEADTHENRLRCGAAVHKLAAQIIAEVEADI